MLILIISEIEGADGDRAALHALDDLAVGFELLFFVRHVATAKENEFGAEQTDALGAAFEGSGIILLGAVLDRFLAEYANVNSFTQTVIVSRQRGLIRRFPPRTGLGPLI